MKKILLIAILVTSLQACSYRPIIDSAGRSGTFNEDKAKEITNDIQHCKYLAKENTNFISNITYIDAMNLRNNQQLSLKAATFRTGLALQSDNPKIEPVLQSVRVTDRDFFRIFSVPFLYGSYWDASVDLRPAYQVVISQKLNLRFFEGKNSVGKTVFWTVSRIKLWG